MMLKPSIIFKSKIEKDKIMSADFSSSWPLPDDFCPPVIGNGTISLIVDPRCSMEQKDYCRGISKPTIVRTGYRYDNHRKELVPFGFFETFSREWGELVSVKQTLDTYAGVVTGKCCYENDMQIEYTVFCRLNSDFCGHTNYHTEWLRIATSSL